jgi:hypothetical protein
MSRIRRPIPLKGDSHRALSLASALVRVAKMGSKPKLSYLFSSLVDDDQELTERADRLLRPQPNPGKPAEVLVPFLTRRRADGRGGRPCAAVAR